ncbi:MAG: LacI family DNA-binding transcriptional regulator [Oscillospiraceae bacterium]|jgi:LacI family transcriptional regulator
MNIYDIAEKSGVSIATVSRILNGGKNVSPKTQEKVLAVMQAEGYTPNVFARGLGLGSIRMVGILCTDVSDIYYAKAVSLMENALRPRGYDTLLCCSGSRIEDKRASLRMLLDKRVDAVVLIGSTFQEETDNSHLEAAAKQVPVLIINGAVDLSGVTCLLCDERSAVANNVSLLAQAGCRRILYLYDTMTSSGGQKRAGYRDGLEAAGIAWEDALCLRVKKSLSAAQQAVAALLRDGTAFDAVMASEDLLAIGAQKALAEAGKRLPIIGFNNSLLAECAAPALTSVDNMLDTLCPLAAGLLERLLDGQEVPQKTVVSAKLMERETFHSRKAEPLVSSESPLICPHC